MYPSEAADSMRTRYRQTQPAQSVRRRPIQMDIAPRRHAAQGQVAPLVRHVASPKPAAKHVPPRQSKLFVQPAAAQKRSAANHHAVALNIDAVPAVPKKRHKYLVKPRRLEHVALVVMAIALFAMGGYISFGGVKANQELTKTTKQLNSGAMSGAVVDAPSGEKPSSSAVKAYTVAADMPRYIRISSLKTQARVMPVGINKKGEVATPSNVHDAAWFNQTAKPGNNGAAFINGHVSTWSTNGVFYNLKKATPGMIIEVERGDGTKLAYKVIKTQTYKVDAVDMNMAVNPVTPGKQGLNIMTCTGNVIKGTSEFDSRLLVMAERVS